MKIFLSSTFSDLKRERAKILGTLFKSGHIPCGMEMFPATHDDQMSHISTMIDDSDAFLLVIGSNYGSIDKDGISYTEKEFDYAKKKNIPILAFLKNDQNITDKRLIDFRNKLQKDRIVNFWDKSEDLIVSIVISLTRAKIETKKVEKIQPKLNYKHSSIYQFDSNTNKFYLYDDDKKYFWQFILVSIITGIIIGIIIGTEISKTHYDGPLRVNDAKDLNILSTWFKQKPEDLHAICSSSKDESSMRCKVSFHKLKGKNVISKCYRKINTGYYLCDVWDNKYP